MLSPTEKKCEILHSTSTRVQMEPLPVGDVSRLHGTTAERVSDTDGRQRVVSSSHTTVEHRMVSSPVTYSERLRITQPVARPVDRARPRLTASESSPCCGPKTCIPDANL